MNYLYINDSLIHSIIPQNFIGIVLRKRDLVPALIEEEFQ